MKKLVIFVILFLILSSAFVSASVIEDTLHLNIQTTYSNGSIQTGTFAFVFNISTASDCSVANVVYTNSTSLTTDSRGIVSYYLENLSLSFSEQYWLCYYRDGALINSTKFSRVPYVYRANVSDNLNATSNYQMANLTLGSLLTFDMLETIDNIVDEWIRVNGNLNVTNNITSGGNVSASYFFGDGSQLTNLPSAGLSGAGTSGYIPMWNGTSSLNNSVIYQNGGNIGIGITNPSATLGVFGNILANSWIGSSSTAPHFILNQTDQTNMNSRIQVEDDLLKFAQVSGANSLLSTPMVINLTSGNIGIGTTTPNSDLHLKSGTLTSTTIGAKDTRLILQLDTSTLDAGGEIVFVFNDTDVGSERAGAFGFAATANTASGGTVRAYIATKSSTPDTTLIERLSVLPNGNVGIGTTTPNHQLEVFHATAGTFSVHSNRETTGDLATIFLSTVNSAGTRRKGAIFFQSSGIGDGRGDIIFANDNAADSGNANVGNAVMTLNSSGYVGIGITNPAGKLNVMDTNGGFFFNGASATYNRFKSTTTSATIGKDLLFSTQDVGTTPDLYIKSDGNVGIGTATPSTTLDVNGNTTIQGQLNISGASRVRVTKDDVQTFTDATYQKIQYDDEEFDNLGEYNTTYSFVATQAGYYSVTGSLLVTENAFDAADSAVLRVYVNGVQDRVLSRVDVQATNTQYIHLHGNTLIQLDAGDFVELWAFIDRGTDTASNTNLLYNYFEVHRLS